MDREQIPDSVLMYACIFTYETQKVRKQINDYQVNYTAIRNYESKYCVAFKLAVEREGVAKYL